MGRGGDGHGLPALLLNRQHVITQQGFHQLIGSPFGRVLVGAATNRRSVSEKPSQSPRAREPWPKASPQEYSQTLQSLGSRVSRCRKRQRRGAKVHSLAVIGQSYGRLYSTALALAIL